MLYTPLNKFADSGEVKVAPGVVIAAEGIALVRAAGAQSAGVTPATGTSADIFVGFAIAGTSAAPFAEGYANKVETFIVPAGGTGKLAFAPVTGQVSVFDLTLNAPDTTFTVSGKDLSGLTAGSEVSVTYKYPLTVVQARALSGDIQPGGYVGAYVDQIGAAKRGVIYTSEFDASVDWASVTAIKMAANGQLTGDAGAGVAINAVVIAVPGTEVPYLGIEFSTL